MTIKDGKDGPGTHMHIRVTEATARRTRALADLDGTSPSEVIEAALLAHLEARGVPDVRGRRSGGA